MEVLFARRARATDDEEAGDMEAYEELFEFARMLDDAANAGDADNIVQPLSVLENASEQVGQSFSGSWLGYHSRVYYDGLVQPPPGASFSKEWGLMKLASPRLGSQGAWREFDPQEIRLHIYASAGQPDLDPARQAALEALAVFDEAKSEAISILEIEMERGSDVLIAELKDKLKKLVSISKDDCARIWAPVAVPRSVAPAILPGMVWHGPGAQACGYQTSCLYLQASRSAYR
jgi:hypothetical protein